MARLSCVICAYNEAERIQPILRAVVGHPDISEVIVVNDGSTDATERVLRQIPGVTLITYPINKGKTYALSVGIEAAKEDLVLLLDADLAGVTGESISALARPVLEGQADVSISLRRNSLWVYRVVGLDFVSGERVVPRALLSEAATAMQALPRWGGEVFMNEYFVRGKYRLAVVRWKNVYNVRKHEKVGLMRGVGEELRMMADACRVLPWYAIIAQNVALLKLKVPETQSLPQKPSTLPTT